MGSDLAQNLAHPEMRLHFRTICKLENWHENHGKNYCSKLCKANSRNGWKRKKGKGKNVIFPFKSHFEAYEQRAILVFKTK